MEVYQLKTLKKMNMMEKVLSLCYMCPKGLCPDAVLQSRVRVILPCCIFVRDF